MSTFFRKFSAAQPCPIWDRKCVLAGSDYKGDATVGTVHRLMINRICHNRSGDEKSQVFSCGGACY